MRPTPRLAPNASGRDLVDRVFRDHEKLREAGERLRREPTGASVEFLHSVGSRLGSHVRLEERELFPHLEASLSGSELQRIAEELERQADGTGRAGIRSQ